MRNNINTYKQRGRLLEKRPLGIYETEDCLYNHESMLLQHHLFLPPVQIHFLLLESAGSAMEHQLALHLIFLDDPS